MLMCVFISSLNIFILYLRIAQTHQSDISDRLGQ